MGVHILICAAAHTQQHWPVNVTCWPCSQFPQIFQQEVGSQAYMTGRILLLLLAAIVDVSIMSQSPCCSGVTSTSGQLVKLD